MPRQVVIAIIILGLCGFAIADDPGEIDSLIIGTIFVETGVPSAMLPVYVVTDDSVAQFVLPLTWESSDDNIHLAGAYYFNILLEWDEAVDTVELEESHIIVRGTSDTGGEPNPVLDTGHQRQLAMMLRVVIRSNAEEQFVPVYPYNDADWGQAIFYLKSGEDFQPVIVPGAIYYQTVGIDNSNAALPGEIRLAQNYPNPFNLETIIGFDLPSHSAVSLEIYDILGRQIRTLVAGKLDAGHYSITWNGNDESGNAVTSGMYFYRLKTGDTDLTGKMVLLK
jgi:hypothetical protein